MKQYDGIIKNYAPLYIGRGTWKFLFARYFLLTHLLAVLFHQKKLFMKQVPWNQVSHHHTLQLNYVRNSNNSFKWRAIIYKAGVSIPYFSNLDKEPRK
mgnify:CR=1 FL=1